MGRMARTSDWKMVLDTDRAMSGRMLKSVRLNSCTAQLSMSDPTTRGA